MRKRNREGSGRTLGCGESLGNRRVLGDLVGTPSSVGMARQFASRSQGCSSRFTAPSPVYRLVGKASSASPLLSSAASKTPPEIWRDGNEHFCSDADFLEWDDVEAGEPPDISVQSLYSKGCREWADVEAYIQSRQLPVWWWGQPQPIAEAQRRFCSVCQ